MMKEQAYKDWLKADHQEGDARAALNNLRSQVCADIGGTPQRKPDGKYLDELEKAERDAELASSKSNTAFKLWINLQFGASVLAPNP